MAERSSPKKYLTDEEKAQLEAMGWDKLMETLKESAWTNRRVATRAATKWIGTAGTSPFGAYGYNPGRHPHRPEGKAATVAR